MKTYLVGYDLNKSGKDYTGLIDEIKGISGTWWHHLDSTFIIKSDLTTYQIVNLLKSHIDSDDELLVVRLNGEWNSIGFNQDGVNWLKNNLSLL